jgi:hypothetical protein
VRTEAEIEAALEEVEEKVWYDRHMMLLEKHQSGEMVFTEEQLAAANASAQQIRDQYGEGNLGPYDDMGWGVLLGKLSALRWVTGSDWDEFWS